MVSGLYEYKFPDRGSCSSHACARAGVSRGSRLSSVWKSIHVSAHKNVENLKMKQGLIGHDRTQRKKNKDESWLNSLTEIGCQEP
jgi:hypothetical protein